MNGLLALELFSAECYFSALPKADSQAVAHYMAELATHLQTKGYQRATLYLDRNTTHQKKMQQLYQQLTTHLSIQMRFVFLAPYSPALNPVEYAIHWLRQRFLHHADYRQTLMQVQQRLTQFLQQNVIFSTQQIINILEHIEQVVNLKRNTNLSPERE